MKRMKTLNNLIQKMLQILSASLIKYLGSYQTKQKVKILNKIFIIFLNIFKQIVNNYNNMKNKYKICKTNYKKEINNFNKLMNNIKICRKNNLIANNYNKKNKFYKNNCNKGINNFTK